MSRYLTVCLFIFSSILSFAGNAGQYPERKDTIPAALKIEIRKDMVWAGEVSSDLNEIRTVISPLGEGDPIRWIQGLSGVTTGADGSSAFYVRGGNLGSNLFSLDGVPVYGYSHLLGLTTAVPQDIIESATLSKGGFGGRQGNFTSSHLRITSRTPSHELRKTKVSLNNFIAGAFSDGPVNEKLSYTASLRWSPLAYEYKIFKGLISSMAGGLDNFSAGIADAYGKLNWIMEEKGSLSVTGFASMDNYGFSLSDESEEKLGWNNVIGIVNYIKPVDNKVDEWTLSYNGYSSFQNQDKIYRGSANHLSLKSLVHEITLSLDRRHSFDNGKGLSTGLKSRGAIFSPGQVASLINKTTTVLTSAYLQYLLDMPEKSSMKVYARGNHFYNSKDNSHNLGVDGGISAKLRTGSFFSILATADYATQYYHTLEGLPLGWSLDMLVPSGRKVRPETALQAYLGAEVRSGGNGVTLGGFYKEMDGLVYYEYAQNLFSGALSDWENHVDQGRGLSYGLEFMHEYSGDDFHSRVSYTWSRTDRRGFENINEGRPFHARFDRRHVLNASAAWKSFSAALIYQSGQWENGAAVDYVMHIPGAQWTADYFYGVNNYKMPDIVRLDVGYNMHFTSKWGENELNIGICNVLNHFNPFMLYFDTLSESWKEMALLPILPNFSWKLLF